MPTSDVTQYLADMFRLLGDQSRLRILMEIREEPIPVGDIARRLDLSPSLVSHHLRLLRAGRLVRSSRQGRQICYALHDDHIRTVLEDMSNHARETAH